MKSASPDIQILFGQGSPLKIQRGLNAQWTQGGLMYALPIR